MRTKVLTNKTNKAAISKTRVMAQAAMLSAVAIVLMLFEFPLPFLAPPFYEMDFSEVPVLIGTFAIGPFAGVMIEALKIILNLIINGTVTAGVGEFANFLIGCAFIVPAGVIYHRAKTRSHAIIGMVTGTLVMTAMGCLLNAYVLLPAYAAAFGMPIEAFIEMGSAIHSSIDSMMTFVILAVAPFNLLKGIMDSVIVFLIYKKVSPIFKMNRS